MTETLAVRAARIIEKGPDAITSGIASDVLIYLARKYVAREWQARQRAEVRHIERESDVKRRRTSEEVKADLYRAARREAWRILLPEAFAVGGELVTWGSATQTEHLQRIAAQSDLAEGINRDIARHSEAVDDLARFRVNSLGEL